MRYKCAINDSTDSYPNYIQLLRDTAVKRFQIGIPGHICDFKTHI